MKAEITEHHFDDGLHAFDYTLHRKSRLKHRYIRIRNAHPIVSVSRHTSRKALESFLAEHAEWVVCQLNKAATERIDLARPDATVLWRGIHLPVILRTGEHNRLDCDQNAAHFTLKTSPTHAALSALLQDYYKTHAPEYILPRVERWAAIMDLHPTHVTFRRARSRWGSCSPRNTLSLNTFLMMLPDNLIDYVIVHELAHIRHKNHSKDFWDLVEQYQPAWKEHRKSIRNYERYLHNS